MLAFYKEKKIILISIVILILDGLISYLLPNYFNKLNYFYPMLTISFIPFLYNKKDKKYYLSVIIIGIIYNILYSNIFLYHPIVFYLLSKMDYLFLKFFKDKIFIYIVVIIINIVIYDSLYFIFIILTSYQDVTILDLVYKIENSLLLNIMSVFVFYFIIKKKRISA